MIEAYAFLAAFALQILIMSVLYPAWFIRYVRLRTVHAPADRLAQMYPGVDMGQVLARFVTRYRVVTAGVAVFGLVLLGWLFTYMRRPDWDDGPVEALVTLYSLLAWLVPLAFVLWAGFRLNKEHKRPLPEAKRTAVLQRRGLFDFVSPFVVLLAVLCYFLFVAFVLYLREHPFPGFAGLVNIVGITLVYAANAGTVYMMLYGKKNPLDTHEGRLHTIGVAAKSCVYSCIVIVLYLALNLALGMLDLQRWEPFAMSVFFVVTALLASMGVIMAPRQLQAEALGS